MSTTEENILLLPGVLLHPGVDVLVRALGPAHTHQGQGGAESVGGRGDGHNHRGGPRRQRGRLASRPALGQQQDAIL